jgi:prevent-host-death family protein
MSQNWSIFDAKARLSELLRLVKLGREVTITDRGKPVARVLPYKEIDEDFHQRLKRLEAEGILTKCKNDGWNEAVRRPFKKVSGGLKRFLDDR